MPLSEDEQRILHEMEQTLRESDRDFAARVDHGSSRLDAAKGARWSLLGAVFGFVVILWTFRTSTVLAAVGFVVLLASALVFANQLRQSSVVPSRLAGRRRARGIGGEWSEVRRKMRSRFGNHD